MNFFIPLLGTLAMVACFIALLIGLCSAPWQLLVLILFGGLRMTEKLLQDNQRRSLADENPTIAFSQFANRR